MKVSINLPNQVVITIEADTADQAEQVRDALRMALRELPADPSCTNTHLLPRCRPLRTIRLPLSNRFLLSNRLLLW